MKRTPNTSLAVILLLASACATSTSPRVHDVQQGSDARSAVLNSLPILQQSADTWFQKRSCGSCHHQGLGMMAVALARECGLPIDETLFDDQLALSRRAAPSAREEVLQGDAGINAQIGQPYKLFALAAARAPADAQTDARIHFLMGKQGRDGCWRSASHRPPLEDSDFTATAVAARAIQLFAPPGRGSAIAAQVVRARDWLAAATPRSHEEQVMQLFGLAWTGGTPAQIDAARTALLSTQRADGGWAQIATRSSDAYATGQALVALNQAAGLAVTDAAYQRGLAFLLATQHEDGTWLVATRRKTEGLPYFETGFPHGEHQFISYAATCWATMALCLAVRPGESPVLMSTTAAARSDASPPNDGVTPLMDEVLYGSLDRVAALLDDDADANAASDHGLTALMCAAGDLAKAQLLVQHGAMVDARSDLGMTAATIAAGWSDGADVMKFLIERGADVNACAKDGATVLMRAVLTGDGEAIEWLLARGADLDAADREGMTPLFYAVAQGDAATARLLLAHGADADAKLRDGVTTPLISAVIDGLPSVVQVLLEHRARLEARDEDGKTALMWAATVDWGHCETLQLLLAHDAAVDARGGDGTTALEQAELNHNAAAAELLRQASTSKR